MGYQFENLLVKENSRRQVESLIRNQIVSFKGRDISSIQVQAQKDKIFVEVDIEVGTNLDDISEQQVRSARDFLEKELGRPINLRVKLIPTKILEVAIP